MAMTPRILGLARRGLIRILAPRTRERALSLRKKTGLARGFFVKIKIHLNLNHDQGAFIFQEKLGRKRLMTW